MIASIPWLLVIVIAAAGAAEPSPAQVVLGHAAEAHRLRVDLARELAAWEAERQRLEALIGATEAETQRLQRAAEVAKRSAAEAEGRLAALGDGSDLDALRLRVAEAGSTLSRGMAELSRRLPSIVLAAPPEAAGEAALDAAVRALEAAERAAGSVSVDVVTGKRDGTPEAVKLLRVAGAAAWWVSLDGQAAGTIRAGADGLVLTAATDPAMQANIIAALGQVEGRQQPAVVLLPGDAP